MPRNRPYKAEFIRKNWTADELEQELNELRLERGKYKAKANQLESQLAKWKRLGRSAQRAKKSMQLEYAYSLDEEMMYTNDRSNTVKDLYYTAFGESVTGIVLDPFFKQNK